VTTISGGTAIVANLKTCDQMFYYAQAQANVQIISLLDSKNPTSWPSEDDHQGGFRVYGAYVPEFEVFAS